MSLFTFSVKLFYDIEHHMEACFIISGLIGASPDAIVMDKVTSKLVGLCEFKAPVHRMYANIPRQYMVQMQGQMAVTGITGFRLPVPLIFPYIFCTFLHFGCIKDNWQTVQTQIRCCLCSI